MSKASPPVKFLPPWAYELGLLLALICRELLCSLIDLMKNCCRVSTSVSFKKASTSRKKSAPRSEGSEERTAERGMNILDLPQLTLDCILEKLSPKELVTVACVCRCLRDRCGSDHLWESHMRKKWGRLLGKAARREWESYAASRKHALGSATLVQHTKPKNWMGCLFSRSNSDADRRLSIVNNTSPADVTMSWYSALESGRRWLPAQIFNRENANVGFVLSCYDAELRYDRLSDTFYARYYPHGSKAVLEEEGVSWNRVRVPPVDISPHEIHASECLSELSPGDQIEVQWRRSQKFPFGWWYGVIGHLDSCDGGEQHCLCNLSDTIILQFKQYPPGSRWRRATVSRKNHEEGTGNETTGFYGGIRKLQCKDEICMWLRHWPEESS
ncbi:F-box protein [Musa troglodytarum]|uniref:F-box protein n=1 Tax=Musa troglodytarum TaxID=320322 RepID=A0A9E7JMY7_9LILI|nr:F-box protein [Musa troglodytarum]URD87015.1 F-box protein [Musa troglodytarum]URD87017.1 F-box protein [Musa troglodytarum]